MKNNKLDKFYQFTNIMWGVLTFVFDIIYDNDIILLTGLAGIIITMVVYGVYLKFYDVRFKKVIKIE